MLKTVVIYRSISGFTKKYATWISEELKSDLYDVQNITVEKLLEYDQVIFGGSLHATGINGVKIIKENLQRLSEKRIIIFTVGASPCRENLVDEISNSNFSVEDQKKIKFFYLRGGFNFDKLDLTNKGLMTLFRIRLRAKKERTPDEEGMLAAYEKPLDCTSKENVREIVNYASS